MVQIRDAHTNIVRIEANGEVILEKEEASVEDGHEERPLIHNYTLKQIYEYAKVPAEEIEFIKVAYEMNYALLKKESRTREQPMHGICLRKMAERLFRMMS